MDNVKWLVFDLGGVLAEYVGTQRLLALMRDPVDAAELYRIWLFSPAVRAFESGRVSAITFACDIIEELGLGIGPDAFLKEFEDFVTGYYPGADALLQKLAARRPLALLSNTNYLQWDKLCRTSGIHRLFRRIFLSYKTGLLKPDAEAFLHVIRELRCAPEDILFFDDNPHNVRGALDACMRAERVDGFAELRETVGRMGLT
jgi:putative hydrolase of the HAD superfamily